MAKLDRQRQLSKMLLRGVTNQFELAAAFGVDRTVICRDLQEIHEQWAEEKDPEIDVLRSMRKKQLDNLLSLTLDSFYISRNPKEEYRIEDRDCPDCIDGKLERLPNVWDEDCSRCQGTGKVAVEVKEISGDAGNPQFLKIAKEIIDQLSKVDGIIPESIRAQKTLITESVKAGGEIQRKVEEYWLEAPEDTIIRARQVIDEIKEKVKSKEAKVIETEFADGKKGGP